MGVDPAITCGVGMGAAGLVGVGVAGGSLARNDSRSRAPPPLQQQVQEQWRFLSASGSRQPHIGFFDHAITSETILITGRVGSRGGAPGSGETLVKGAGDRSQRVGRDGGRGAGRGTALGRALARTRRKEERSDESERFGEGALGSPASPHLPSCPPKRQRYRMVTAGLVSGRV